MTKFIGAMTIPPVSAEFVKSLRHAFAPHGIEPGFCRDTLMRSVGEQRVIEWIEAKAMQGRTVTGEAAALRNVHPTGAIVKLGE